MKVTAKISLTRIRENLLKIKAEVRSRVLLMVKADAYGHGMTEVARAVDGFADMLGVATLEEGVELRNAGVTLQVLVTTVKPSELLALKEYELIAAIGSLDELYALSSLSPLSRPDAHLKLNTGMNRFGISSNELDDAEKLIKSGKLKFGGCYTHLRTPDSGQTELFDSMCQSLSGVCSLGIRHVYASSSANNTPRYDMVRVGLKAYDNAMTVETEVISTGRLKKGEYLGYGNNAVESDCNVAWIFGGYQDGIDRERPQNVIIRDTVCRPSAVCMDATAVLTPFKAEVGERVILQNDVLTAERVAEESGTIPYTVLTSRKGRFQRIYYD